MRWELLKASRLGMIGNDVVDLTAAVGESDWRRKGFLKKVFTHRERQAIFQAENQHQMVWLLWSMKEAAYKARQRTFSLPRLLDWQSLECTVSNLSAKKAAGSVKTFHTRFFTTTDLFKNVIHTTAANFPDSTVEKEVLENSSDASKKALLEFVATNFSVSVSELSITKNTYGVPAIRYHNRVLFDRFSLSDHGKFAGFSLSLRIS